MTELRFPEALYAGPSVDEAVNAFAEHGRFELERRDGDFVVRLSAEEGVDERELADELANMALGLTIERATDATRRG